MYKIYNNNHIEIDSASSFVVASRVVEFEDRNNVAAGPHYCKPA